MPIIACYRPTDCEHALLSNHVYHGNRLEKGTEVPDAKGWTVGSVHPGPNGFFAAIYENKRKHHMVVAFRGTDSMGALIEDVRGIFFNGAKTPQKEAAFKVTMAALEKAVDRGWTLSLTGHSLGAYLAELSLFYFYKIYQTSQASQEDEEEIDLRDHIHAVTFESPGTFDIMKKLQGQIAGAEIVIEQLDITTYLSYPNLVNTCNRQAGTVYSIEPKISTWSNLPGWHLKQVHSMDHIVSLFQASQGNCPVRHFMQDWPVGNQRAYYFKQVRLEGGQYRWKTPPDQIQRGNFKFVVSGHFSWNDALSTWKTLAKRHIQTSLWDWMKLYFHAVLLFSNSPSFMQRLSAKYAEMGVSSEVISFLMSIALVKVPGRKISYLAISSGDATTALAVCQELSACLSKRGLADKLLSVISELQQEPDIKAEVIASGAVVDGGLVDVRSLKAISVDIPLNTDKALVSYFKQVSSDFIQMLKDKGVTVVAQVVAPGGVVKNGGEVRVGDVSAVSFTVGSEPPVLGEEVQALSGGLALPEANASGGAIAKQRQKSGIHQKPEKSGGGGSKEDHYQEESASAPK